MAENDSNQIRKPLAWWDALTKTVVGVPYQGSFYEVEIDFLGFFDEATLYRDGIRQDQKGTAASFEIAPDAKIEVNATSFGIKYARLVTPAGAIPMKPLPETLEYKRIRWDYENPGLARALSVASFLTLIVAAVLGIPQILEFLSNLDIARSIGFEFTSPISLPAWANSALSLLALLAAIERGTRMKYNWWLEGLSDDLLFSGE